MTDAFRQWLTARQPKGRLLRGVSQFERPFRRAREVAGLGRDVIPYTIRHTMATELRRRGVPGWEVQGMLGHSAMGTTEVYAKYAPDYMGEARQALDAYWTVMRDSCVAAPGISA